VELQRTSVYRLAAHPVCVAFRADGIGIPLDRSGSVRVNAIMLTAAAGGATLFDCAGGTAEPAMGRMLLVARPVDG
jgi:hypothetical protein